VSGLDLEEIATSSVFGCIAGEKEAVGRRPREVYQEAGVAVSVFESHTALKVRLVWIGDFHNGRRLVNYWSE